MTSIQNSGELVRQAELLTPDEQLAVVGFLAGYSGLTRQAYQLDLRQWVAWCAERRLRSRPGIVRAWRAQSLNSCRLR